MIGHVGGTASARIAHLYREPIPRGGKVLDLMSSMHSHIPQGHAGQMVGLGMNTDEMNANPAFGQPSLA